MRHLRIHHVAVLVVGAVLGAHPGAAQTGESSPTTGSNMPSDIDPQSGFRLPLPKREDLDEAGRKIYDRAMTPGATLAGLQGPAGIRFYSPKTSPHLEALNRYLRFEAGLSPRIREIAILVVAREMDSQFEWVAHEPQALKDGVPPDVIDVIKHRKSTEGLDPTDALVITLGRQIWRDHKVTADIFAKAKEIFGSHKLIDLVLLMGNYAATAALLATRHAAACGEETAAADSVTAAQICQHCSSGVHVHCIAPSEPARRAGV